MEQDQEFLEFIVKNLVDNPGEVKIERKVDEMGVLLTLSVHSDDMGRIIGKSGNTANAIRTLLKVVGLKNSARVNFKINETEERSSRARKPEKEESASDVDAVMEELKGE